MTDSTRVLVGRVMSAVAVTAAVAGSVWMVLLGRVEELWLDYLVHNAVVAVGLGAMVWMVVPAQNRNRVVWISALAATTTGLVPLLTAAFYQVFSSLGMPGPVWSAVPAELPLGLALLGTAINSIWMGALLVPTLVVIHLPDGRLPSTRWQWLVRAVWGFWALAVAGFAWGTRPSATATYGSTQQVEILSGLSTQSVIAVGYLGVGLMIPLCVAGMVIRFRRSAGVARQQLRWVAWGASIAGPLLVTAIAYETVGRIDLAQILLVLALVILVASFGVAIGKYRLYDVDVVINRTVVFAVLAGFVAVMYATITVGLGSIIGSTGEGWAPIVATAVVALAFEPVRHVAQRWANRLAYGHRASPYEVLADLTGRLTGSGEGESILDRMAALVVDGTGAAEAIVWLGEPGEMTPVAATGTMPPSDRGVDLKAESVFSVIHDGVVVGALEVIKPRGSALSSQERALMNDLSGSAGAVFGYQRLNETLALKALEIEESRRRLVEAEDLERRRLEQELNEGAQQLILALKVNIGLAQRAASEYEAPALIALLSSLADETQAALDEVRNLAKGIYPPVLESDGLGPAVSALASGAPVDVDVSRDGIDRYSPDIEAAVYFDIAEALTNAVKHAAPPIRIVLGEDNGLLRFSVSDSGPGFDLEAAGGGSGLENLFDRVDAIGGRLEIISSPGGGTEVVGEIPLRQSLSRALPV